MMPETYLFEFDIPLTNVRNWEKSEGKGVFFSIIENPLFDLRIAFNQKPSSNDNAYSIPRIQRGESQYSFHLPEEFNGFYLDHTTVSGLTLLKCLVGKPGVDVILNI